MYTSKSTPWHSTVFAIACLVGPVAAAQDTKLMLRVADHFPATGHPTVEGATRYWMEQVTRQTDNQVQFQHYPAEQLGKAKDSLSLAQSGVADITAVLPSLVSDKMPLSTVAELPGAFSTSCAGVQAYSQLAKEGILAKEEFAPNGVRVLFSSMLSPYQLLTKKEFSSLKDFAGLKIRTAGGAKDLAAVRVKGVPVRMAAPEVYESLSRGTIDAIVWPLNGLATYGLQKLVRYSTADENFGNVVINYVISEARFKKLPDNVQQVMLTVGEEATRRACTLVDKNAVDTAESLKRAGITMVTLPASERAELQALMKTVGAEWAEGLDKRNKPGTQVLEAFDAALRRGR
ncbi:MAG: TRAP transporter substrate-binding protein DctP [Burkholderiales bacterium]|nr:TRAP transporter substrate-binding protein DctP [Burkholderiales bacterium]